jgi:predicted cupin superfamily sugar epimerase
MTLSASDIIARLELRPHPEGGYYRETFRDKRVDDNGRANSTAIYFLLARGDRSHWHIAHDGCAPHLVTLGPDLAAGQRPQAIVPADAWQSAETTGDWTLVGCTVAPGFEFAGFEMAQADFEPAG